MEEIHLKNAIARLAQRVRALEEDLNRMKSEKLGDDLTTLEVQPLVEGEVERLTCTGCKKALEIIHNYGDIDGSHHKQWVLDQIARVLAGDRYGIWVKRYKTGENGPETFEWDEGIAP